MFSFYLKFKSKPDSNNYTFNVHYTTNENEDEEDVKAVKHNKHLADQCNLTIEVMSIIY